MSSSDGDARVIKMGVIGIGAGATAMIPVFAGHPGFQWTAGCDIDEDVLSNFASDYSAETFTDADEMCRSADIDAVYIASPNRFHMEHTLAALENGKHVLSEKPLAITLADTDLMIDAANRNKVVLAVNVKHSFELRVLKLREFVSSGQFGPLRMIHSWYFTDWLYRPRTPEELNPDWGGGVPWRQGPHQLDIIRTIGGGLVRSVRGMAGTWDESRPVPGAHAAFMEFENGVVATAVYSGYDHFSTRPLIRGFGETGPLLNEANYARGRKTMREATPGFEMEVKRANRYGGSRRAAGPDGGESGGKGGWASGGPMIVSFDHADIWMMPEGLLVCDDDAQQYVPVPNIHGDGRWGRVNTFREAIVNDTAPAADGRWGKATLEVILALIQSGRERREIYLEHQTPTPDAAFAMACV